MKKEVIIIGGGAAGFFAAITCAETHPDCRVSILEKSAKLLAKVKVSGGGRCNVTHACFEARELVKFYPRGQKQLLGPFTKFNPRHTIGWFSERGVELKTEEDGRMFPITDSSQTIINCFLTEAKKSGVSIRTQVGVEEIKPLTDEKNRGRRWRLVTNTGEHIEADAMIVASGSSPRVWKLIEELGIKIIPPVPSLFTFNMKDERIKGLEGLSVPNAVLSILNLPDSLLGGRSQQLLFSSGPLLITHWGLSGPAVLRLSAWGARALDAVKHQFELEINWTGDLNAVEVKEHLIQFKQQHPKKSIAGNPLFNVPQRLWERLTLFTLRSIDNRETYANLSNKQMEQLVRGLTAAKFKVNGKSTFKEEFVTAGGIDLDEMDFKTMQSKKFPGLYFAGEVLDIDAITGGFNFQAAWTTAWLAGTSVTV